MTVGERYQKTWQAAWDRENPEAAGISFTDGAHRCMDAAIPGLWDAEVLEGVLLVDEHGETGPNEVQVIADDASYAIIGHDGTSLRVIVLPAKESSAKEE